MDPQNYTASETLEDGSPVTIRAIRHDDGNTILEAFKNLDRDSVYRRFFKLLRRQCESRSPKREGCCRQGAEATSAPHRRSAFDRSWRKKDRTDISPLRPLVL